jgi:hypothetical protein
MPVQERESVVGAEGDQGATQLRLTFIATMLAALSGWASEERREDAKLVAAEIGKEFDVLMTEAQVLPWTARLKTPAEYDADVEFQARVVEAEQLLGELLARSDSDLLVKADVTTRH